MDGKIAKASVEIAQLNMLQIQPSLQPPGTFQLDDDFALWLFRMKAANYRTKVRFRPGGVADQRNPAFHTGDDDNSQKVDSKPQQTKVAVDTNPSAQTNMGTTYVAGLETDQGKWAALTGLLRSRAEAGLNAARRSLRKMDWAATKGALAAEFGHTERPPGGYEEVQNGQDGHGCDKTVFFATLQQSLGRALPELDGVLCQQLLSDRFVESVQPAFERAAGQLSVEHLVHLAHGLAQAPLVTLQS
ncbi:hypothetical protein CLF_100939 [Clonorchis sinensis]|uniref:Uncharacterized protein n=1 Tax=Clonorchis sinensis TaxID=79923 RepID=G7Y4K9_CLOSI|nr:hypothetical protein CLF_100939 [Clonorchis sinensis]